MKSKLVVGLFGLLVVLFSCSDKGQMEDGAAEDTLARVTSGNNPAAGKYVQAGGARIYYEVYGDGPALVLLHSDFYGYIDDFEEYLPILIQQYKVIAIGKRGHGKSEMGKELFTEALFAGDVLAVLRHEKVARATLLGFGGGATTAYYLAAHYPEHVVSVVALAGLLGSDGYRKGVKEDLARIKFRDVAANAQDFVKNRRKLMPQPQRFEELLERLKLYWLSGPFVEEASARRISCPVLVVTGDRDYYQGMDAAISIQKTIPGAKLAVVPGCDRPGLMMRPALLKRTVIPFLKQ